MQTEKHSSFGGISLTAGGPVMFFGGRQSWKSLDQNSGASFSVTIRKHKYCKQSACNMENAEVIVFRSGTIGWLAQFVPVSKCLPWGAQTSVHAMLHEHWHNSVKE